MKREIIATKDGANTILSSKFNASYHSLFGAIQEANHVFLKSGFGKFENEKEISILEIGFGTGLNAILTLIEAKKQQKTVHYSTLEAFPVTSEEIALLNYKSLLEISPFSEEFDKIQEAEWDKEMEITPFFSLHKIHQKMEDFIPKKSNYNLIYFDAFGPGTQPEMWTKAVLQKMYDSLVSDGVFVTYCAKGEVRRTLIEIGFQVERLAGPPGKREMLRATK